MTERDQVLGTVYSWNVDDQLRFVQEVWDHIAHSGHALEPSDELKEELDRRIEAADRNPDDAVDWQSVVDFARRKP